VTKFLTTCVLVILFSYGKDGWINYKYAPSEIFFLLFVDYIAVISFSYN